MQRFVPPALDALRPNHSGEIDAEADRIREGGFAEGHALGMREGRLAGIREGEARARQEVQAELAELRGRFAKQDAAGRLAEAVERMLADREEADRDLEESARAAMTAALRLLFPALLASAIGPEVVAVVREALVARAPETLNLRAHPDTLALVARADLPQEAAGRLTLSPDATLEHGAVVIAWSGGGLSFDPAALLERVAGILSPISVARQDAAHE